MVNSKDKGRRGEQELVRKLKEYGYNVRRSVQYNGRTDEGQADVVGLPGVHIEVKRVERLNLYDAVSQVKRDKKQNELGAIFHRKNNCEWLVTMRLEEWIKLYKNYEME